MMCFPFGKQYQSVRAKWQAQNLTHRSVSEKLEPRGAEAYHSAMTKRDLKQAYADEFLYDLASRHVPNLPLDVSLASLSLRPTPEEESRLIAAIRRAVEEHAVSRGGAVVVSFPTPPTSSE